jgi:hypothetical protein
MGESLDESGMAGKWLSFSHREKVAEGRMRGERSDNR